MNAITNGGTIGMGAKYTTSQTIDSTVTTLEV